MTDEYLEFTRDKLGNDLITPHPNFKFPGLKAGDKWCVCAQTWKVAEKYGKASPVVIDSTHEKALNFVTIDTLKTHKIKKTKDS